MDLGDVGQVLISSREQLDARKCQVIPDHKSTTNMTQEWPRYRILNQYLLFCVANLMVANAISTLRSGCFKVSSNAKFNSIDNVIIISLVTNCERI